MTENIAPLHFPLMGNSIAIGLFSLLHIALAGLSVGFMILAPLFEASDRRNPYHRDFARGMTRFTVVVFSVSTVLAVIMVELMIGLFPNTTMWIWNRFREPLAWAVAAFLLQLMLLYPYYHFWDQIEGYSRSLHVSLGALAAGSMLVWVAILDGMGSYMLTPVDAPTSWSHVPNPTWGPLVLHRLVGNLVIAGYVLAAYGAWRSGRKQDLPACPYYLHLFTTGWLIGASALLLQPFTGLWYGLAIDSAGPPTPVPSSEGYRRSLLYVQFILLGLLFVGTQLLVIIVRPSPRRLTWRDGAIAAAAVGMVLAVDHATIRRISLYSLALLTLLSMMTDGRRSLLSRNPQAAALKHLALALAIVSLLVYLTMGTIRETARHPDTIRGKISLLDEERTRQPAHEGAR